MIKCSLITSIGSSYGNAVTPSVDFKAQGGITLSVVVAGAVPIYVSFDGVHDAFILAPTVQLPLSTRNKTYQKVWLKTASGSPQVAVTCES